MKPPTIAGTIDRRILVSYRIDPDLAAGCLPVPFRPALKGGVAVGGVCLIRLTALRPRPIPRLLGITTENVAHRFAVEWDGPTGVETGVFVPRRDTSSRLSALLGGRLFPGRMAHGQFHVDEGADRFHVRYRSDDGSASVEVRAALADRLPERSLFDSLDEASDFFRRDSVGHSPRLGGMCDAVELRTTEWNVRPLEIDWVHSSWFDDERLFPHGTIELDSALVMRKIPAQWVAVRHPLTAREPTSAR